MRWRVKLAFIIESCDRVLGNKGERSWAIFSHWFLLTLYDARLRAAISLYVCLCVCLQNLSDVTANPFGSVFSRLDVFIVE